MLAFELPRGLTMKSRREDKNYYCVSLKVKRNFFTFKTHVWGQRLCL